MALSSSSLIHLTDKIENLQGILNNGGFRIKYCLETIEIEPAFDSLTYAVPMVSFSDIPLSEIRKQIGINRDEGYGNYGIGYIQDYCKSRGLSPVLYLERWGIPTRKLKMIYDMLLNNKKFEEYGELENNLIHIFRFIKNYQSTLHRSGKEPRENYRFSDEREWRWVPSRKDAPMLIMSKEIYDDEVQREYYNKQLIELGPLELQPQHIRYIIVKEEKEIPIIVQTINQLSNKYSQEIIELLKSRIITTEQILNDF